jgi:hypothetical protein
VLDELAIKAIVIDSRSFGDFRRFGMQGFLRIAIPGYFGPAARTVQRNSKNLYNEKKKLLKEELASIECVSITTDLWRCGRKRHYICITAHFITATFNQRNTILSFREFYGRSFAIHIDKLYASISEDMLVRVKLGTGYFSLCILKLLKQTFS